MKVDKLAINGGQPVRSKPLPTVFDSSGRNFGDEEVSLVVEVIKSGILARIHGVRVKNFEKEFAQFHKVKYAVASSSGTAAIHLALAALNTNPGDEVITTPVTDVGTVIPILWQNAIPVFADVDPKTYNIDPYQIEKKITEKTKAIIVVHLFGNPCDMDPILKMAKHHNLRIIEDCSQAYLAEYKGKKVGTIGDFGCFSLGQSKHMTTGEGGITITDSGEFIEQMRLFPDKGWIRGRWGPRSYSLLGLNCRMTELQGAIGLAQLKKLEDAVMRRIRAACLLTELLKNIEIVSTAFVLSECVHTYWMYPILLKRDRLSVSVNEFGEALQAEGIPNYPGYISEPIFVCSEPLSTHKVYGNSHCPFSCSHSRAVKYEWDEMPQTRKVLERLIAIPWNEFYTKEDVGEISKAVVKVSENYRI